MKAICPATQAGPSPFDPECGSLYQQWRDRKLDGYPASAADLIVEVGDPRHLSPAESAELLRVCRKTNMAIYSSGLGALADKEIPRQLGLKFGLSRLDSNMLADDDGITSLQVVPGKSLRGYIPYSNSRLLWHTDGYYNPPGHCIKAFVLHCVSPAAEGGDNELLDPEIVYILLRDASPDYIRALMEPDAMTIPANTESGEETRPAQPGPVFSVEPHTGNLRMRYTARTRSVVWKQDTLTQQAVTFLQGLLAGDSPHVFRARLAAGQGLLNNNVLHNRTGFRDEVDKDRVRLIYRARYFDRIRGTNLNEISESRI